MKLKNILRKVIFLLIFSPIFSQNTFAQCFQIESILVDACEGAPNTEGLNEMVRFKVGSAAINTTNMSVNWPSNGWGGLIQNTITATKVASLNAAILAAGGCGEILQPTGGVLPANATVVLVTSYNFDTVANSFGALTDTIYILFQNKNETAGHFGNFGTSATRTLKISFGTCSDTVTYNRSLLINQSGQNAAGDGATVLFTPAGVASYTNNGCVAPVSVFTVDANPATSTTCAGNPVSLTGTAAGQQSVIWSAPSGTFSNATSLSTTFTPSTASAGTTITVTLTATNSCGTTISDTVNVTVSIAATPDFNVTPLNICTGSSVPTLSTTSPNGISGTWNPAVISSTASGTYTFTPSAGQCATSVSLNVTVGNSISPSFNVTPLNICTGGTVPTLSTTSPNGISGTWSPAIISNTASGTYTFTPSAGQCATSVSLNVTVGNSITPSFNVTPLNICTGGTVPTLSTTSPNGISGTWNPAVISNTASGTYTFTPNAGQCATSVSLNVTVGNSITPNFNVTPLNICTGETVPTLSTTSPNGISGTWSPAVISNTASGTYTFTPNAGQCATSVSLNVTVGNSITPSFNVTPLNICTGSSVPTLSTTSPNGISGTWSPAVISNTASGTYTFTPSAGQCATSVSLNVTVGNSITPSFNVTPLNICTGSSVPTLSTTSPNGISGTWSPAIISNTASGTYTFTPSAGQCATSVSLNVTVGNSIAPNFNVTPLNICTGGTVPTLSTTSPNGISGTWSPAVISNTASGTYTFTPSAGQCATSVSLNVTVTTLASTPISGVSQVCTNETIQLTNSTSGGIWSSSNISIATVDSNGNVTGIASGNTIIKYTISNGSCSISETKTITVNALPNPVLSDKFICISNQTGLPISNAILNSQVPDNGNYSFVWTLNNNPISNTTNTHQATVAGVYKVVVTNLITGCTASATASVTVATNATATASIEQDFDRNQTITINVTGGSGSFEYQLENGPVQTSNQFTGIYSGEYQITVRDTNGCTELFLDVFAYNYPRYFSPNEDGYNDYWNIKSLSDQPDAQIYIFDRYGKLLKYLTPATVGWDGTYNGRQLPSTDYWFKVIYKGRTGNEKEFKAHFAMKR